MIRVNLLEEQQIQPFNRVCCHRATKIILLKLKGFRYLRLHVVGSMSIAGYRLIKAKAVEIMKEN